MGIKEEAIQAYTAGLNETEEYRREKATEFADMGIAYLKEILIPGDTSYRLLFTQIEKEPGLTKLILEDERVVIEEDEETKSGCIASVLKYCADCETEYKNDFDDLKSFGYALIRGHNKRDCEKARQKDKKTEADRLVDLIREIARTDGRQA